MDYINDEFYRRLRALITVTWFLYGKKDAYLNAHKISEDIHKRTFWKKPCGGCGF